MSWKDSYIEDRGDVWSYIPMSFLRRWYFRTLLVPALFIFMLVLIGLTLKSWLSNGFKCFMVSLGLRDW